MFQNLRVGTPLYVLHKNELKLEVGEVTSVTPPRPQQIQNFGMGVLPPQQTVIDVEVKLDSGVVKIPNLLTTLSITDCSNGVVVSDSRESMLNEITVLKGNSQKILNSIDQHKEIVRKCDDLLGELNPQIRQEAERSKEIESLSARVGGLESSIGRIEALLTRTLDDKPKEK